MEAPNNIPQGEKEQNFFKEILKASIIALIIVIPIRIFVAQPYIVAGSSMYPTFKDGHYIIVDELTYRFEPPKRGDVIIFRYPKDPSKFFIKRVIGLPGETVVINDGKVLIAPAATSTVGIVLPEPYVAPEDRSYDSMKRTLLANEYFVMGDNRNASSDSRIWGPLPEKNIVGRAILRVLPVGEMGVLPGAYAFHDLTELNQSEDQQP